MLVPQIYPAVPFLRDRHRFPGVRKGISATVNTILWTTPSSKGSKSFPAPRFRVAFGLRPARHAEDVNSNKARGHSLGLHHVSARHFVSAGG